jgi:hypothetical protein
MRIGDVGSCRTQGGGRDVRRPRACRRAERLPANPFAGVERPHSTSRRKRYLTADQVELMAEAARAPAPTRPRLASTASFEQYRLVVYVLAYCGLH